jgi:hydroxypyruvate isomerase
MPDASTLKFSANLSWLYTDLPFLDRFEAAARDGFEGVECLFPHEHSAADIAARLRGLGLELVLFNAPPGDWAQGERGLACLAGREADFQASIMSALALAETLGCPRIHVMAGVCAQAAEGSEARRLAMDLYASRLSWAARQAETAGRTLMIEPINPRDMPGYLLTRQAEAQAVVARIGSPRLQVQMDLYHCQIVEGDVTMQLRRWLPGGTVGHLQIASVPDRAEPDDGELAYRWVFEELRRLRWSGWIGCEYRPRAAPDPSRPGAATRQGLRWMRHAEAQA